MTKLPLLLRFFSFILVFFFLPIDFILNNNIELLIKKFIYAITLFASLTKLCDTFFITLAKRKEDEQPYNTITFYCIILITLALTIISITLLQYYIDKVQFFIVLLMIVIRITEINLSYTHYHLSNVICAILFDSFAGCLSFELVTPTPIIHTVLIGTSLAFINGALLITYIVKINANQNKEIADKNLKDKHKKTNKKKQKLLLCKEIVLNKNLPNIQKHHSITLLRCYQILAIMAPAILGLCITFKFISIYYYITFLIIFPSMHLYTKANKAVQNNLYKVKDIYMQTAFISLAFVILILIARILTTNFPTF